MEFVIGIDEVGRGPLAGPVSVCVLSMSVHNYEKFKKMEGREKLRDSKKLSEKKRNEWFEKIENWRKEGFLNYSYQTMNAAEIDELGISVAIKKCVENGLEELKTNSSTKILLDGSLIAPPKFKNQTTIIRGDEKESIISLASIVAKVTRDNYMKTLAEKFPNFGLEIHKGYGTLSHRQAIKKYGLSDVHRKSFCKKVVYDIKS
jgi:ribonuclease HII